MSVVCSILVWGFGSLKSINELFCSLALALVPFQCSLDQSNSQGKGCRVPCLQYELNRPKFSHAFFGIGAFISTLFNSHTFVSGVLGLLIFIGLNQFLPDHLVLILPVVCFLRFLGILVGVENWTVLPSFHGIVIFCLLSSWNACIFYLREGNGITFLLHGVKIIDSTVWSFLCVCMPLNVPKVKSTSIMFVGRQVLINPKIKSQTGLISLAISAIFHWSF